LFPAILKYGSAFFTDLRYQEIIASGQYSIPALATALGISLLLPAAVWEFLRRNKISAADFFKANLPLAVLGIQYFLPVSFPLLIINLVFISLSAGRTAALCKDIVLPDYGKKRTLAVLCLIVVLYAVFGAIQQYHSLNTLAMSWFDWGHFFECLYNFFHGKPFYLNLNGGSFLGSRFTPTLILLLPVVATGSPFLFFFAGSLFPILQKLLAAATPVRKRGKVFGWSTTFNNIGGMLSTVFSGWVIFLFGTRGVFFAAALLTLILIPVTVWGIRVITNQPFFIAHAGKNPKSK
jgi:MFS family permease